MSERAFPVVFAARVQVAAEFYERLASSGISNYRRKESPRMSGCGVTYTRRLGPWEMPPSPVRHRSEGRSRAKLPSDGRVAGRRPVGEGMMEHVERPPARYEQAKRRFGRGVEDLHAAAVVVRVPVKGDLDTAGNAVCKLAFSVA